MKRPFRTIAKTRAAFERRYIPEPNSGCWLWSGAHNRGYGQIQVRGKTEKAPRLSWMLHRGPIQDGRCVLHRCDNPACVNPEHLFLGTHADNAADRAAKGRGRNRVLRGEKNPQSKLTREAVLQIHDLLASGATQRSLAARFGVGCTTITRIASGRSYV